MDAELLFVRGKDAVDHGNIEGGLAVFLDILREFPDHLNSRLVLRGLALQKFAAKGGGLSAKVSGFFKGLGPLLLMHLTGNPRKISIACERFLVNYPTNVHVLSKLGSACRNLGCNAAAASTLEFARQQAPGSIKVLKSLAEAFVANKEHQKALRCYEQVLQRKPSDRTMRDRMKNIAATGHMVESKIEQSESYREQIRDKEEAETLEQEQHIVRTEDQIEASIAHVQKQLQENHEDESLLIKLGELYERQFKNDFAMQAYKKAYELSRKFSVRQRMGNLRIKVLKEIEGRMKKAADAQPDNEELKAKADKAHQTRLDFCLKEFELRQKQYPTDLNIAYHLGEYYLEKEDQDSLQKAITLFQRAANDGRLTGSARYMLGLSFARDEKTRGMAIGQFERALSYLPSLVGDRAKEIQYHMAKIYEEEGNTEKAAKIYKQICEIDASYRDVLDKVRELS